ncbi:MAG: hypothetical protein J0I06_07335 [Planctomycetes bacterium]|nr:hypothetical protein [Planctomycetota bacterium]
MPAPPSVAPFAGLLADLAQDLRRGSCCLVVCDKGWTLPLYAALKERLRAANVRCGYLDGRPTEESPNDAGVMLATVAQMRYAARSQAEGVVYALPHLDVMTTTEGGWTTISREVVPLLYENAATVWLGFRDPSLPLLQVVEKVFTRRYVIDQPYRTLETVSPPPPSLPLVPIVPPTPAPAEEANEPEPPEEPPADLPPTERTEW